MGKWRDGQTDRRRTDGRIAPSSLSYTASAAAVAAAEVHTRRLLFRLFRLFRLLYLRRMGDGSGFKEFGSRVWAAGGSSHRRETRRRGTRRRGGTAGGGGAPRGRRVIVAAHAERAERTSKPGVHSSQQQTYIQMTTWENSDDSSIRALDELRMSL